MAFFRKKTETIQDKIDSLKKKQVHEEFNFNDPIPLPQSIPDISPEEQHYLDSLEKSVQEGKSILATPRRRRSGILTAVQIEEDAPDPSANDPFSVAEREVESMVREGQSRFESQIFAPQRQEPVQETPAAVQTPIPEPEEPSQPTETDLRRAQVDSSYDHLGNLPFPPGTLVRLNDDSLGIIKEEIHDREYDLVYILTLEGNVEPHGVCLFSVGIERLGRLPKEELHKIEKTMSWNRDHLIYYLDDVKMAGKIPQPKAGNGSSAASETPAVPRFDDGASMQRGRCVSVIFGTKKWEAVYWGEDSMGTIVAHNQQGEWELLHMDLKRFGSSVKPGKLLQGAELKAIEKAIVARYASA